MSEVMFQLNQVSKSFGEMYALSDISLVIEKGETVALVGPSGAGKSTLLNILAASAGPDTGEVIINGRRAKNIKPGRELARKVGIIHQQLDLVSQLAVIHNVLAGRLGEWGFFRSLLSLIAPREKDLAFRALKRVGLSQKKYERTAFLSGGEQQRVALARLLVQHPKAILADEPVSALDPARAEDLLSMLVNLTRAENQTLVAALHSIEYARRYFSRIVGLREGRVYFDLEASQVNNNDLAQLFNLKDDHHGKAEPLLA